MCLREEKLPFTNFIIIWQAKNLIPELSTLLLRILMRALLIVVLQILKVCIQQVAARENVKIFVTFKIEIIKYSIDTLLMADDLHRP